MRVCLFFMLWYPAILVPESFDSAYRGVRHSDLLVACVCLRCCRRGMCMWSGALVYLVVLGMVARGDTQAAGRAGARYCSACFLPEWESLDNDDASCSMRLSVGCYTTLLAHVHSALLLQATAPKFLALKCSILVLNPGRKKHSSYSG